jgi:hypothetical protein
MTLFEEIKRRKVVRMAAAYLIVAWVIVQVVDVVKDPLALPDWFHTVVIVLLAIMFPVALMLSWAYDVTPGGVVRDGEPTDAQSLRIDYGKISLVAVLILGAFLIGNYIPQSETTPLSDRIDRDQYPLERYRLDISSPLDIEMERNRSFALSPDGQTIVISATIDSVGQLLSRKLGDLDFIPINGTTNAGIVFAISPDGRNIAFQDSIDGLIKKVPLTGGAPISIVKPLSRIRDITWGQSGFIVYAERASSGLMRVTDSGGEAARLTNPDADNAHKHPSFIQDTNILAICVGAIGSSASSLDRLAFLMPDGELRVTDIAAASPVVTTNGQIVYVARNTVWSAPFDKQTLEIGREPVAVAENVEYVQSARFKISHNGTMLYRTDQSITDSVLVLVGRDGSEQLLPFAPGQYYDPSVSPDGSRIAVVQRTAYGPDLWIHSIDGVQSRRITEEESLERAPTWSPDGSALYFSANRRDDIFHADLNKIRSVTQLTSTATNQFPSSVSPDGRYLFIYERRGEAGNSDIGRMDLANDAVVEYILQTPFQERQPAISPDGKWLAYASDLSGSPEIFIRPYPITDDVPVQISVGGGRGPDWGPESDELFYWGATDIMSVRFSASDGLRIENPVALFSRVNYEPSVQPLFYTSSDKFIFAKTPVTGDSAIDGFILVKNWDSGIIRQQE